MFGKHCRNKNENRYCTRKPILFQVMILSLSLVACLNQPTPSDYSNISTSLPTEDLPDTSVVVSPSPFPEQDHTWKASPILVRLDRVAGLTSYEYAWSLTPDLILYADGMLMGTNWQSSGIDDVATVWQIQLSNPEMCGILYALENFGYFNYSPSAYEEPQITDLDDTTLSVQAWQNNLINAYGLWYGANMASNQGSPLVKAHQYLSNLQPEHVSEYKPNRLAILVSETQQNSTEVASPLWPYEEIKLAEIMTEANDYSYAETLVEGTLAKEMYDRFAGYWAQTYIEDDKIYQVTIRPLFPLEIYKKVDGWGSLASFEQDAGKTLTCTYDERKEIKVSSAESDTGPYEEVRLHWITSFGLRNAPGQLDDADLIAVSPNDHLWVANSTNARLEELTLSGERLSYLSMPKDGVAALDFIPDGRMAFLVPDSNSIQILDASGQVVETIENLPYLNENDTANLFAIGWDGRIVLGYYQGNSILLFDPRSKQVETWLGPEDDPFKDITDVDLDKQGNLYVADLRKDRVLRRAPDGQIQVIPVDAPFHVIALSDSSFYVVGHHYITYFATDGTLLKKWTDQDLEIIDVTLASDESLLVLNNKLWSDGPAIIRFDQQGNQIATLGDAPLQPGQFDAHNAFSVSALGDIWVMDTEAWFADDPVNPKLIHLGPNQEYLNSFTSIADVPFLCDRYSLAAHSDQTVFIADPCLGQITHLAADGLILHQWGMRGLTEETFNLLMDLSLATDEQSLYVVDAGNNHVTQFSLDGQKMAVWDGNTLEVSKIKAMDTAPDGSFFILDEATNEVIVFSQGASIQRWHLPSNKIFAYDLAFDPEQQKLYVGTREGVLFIFDWAGIFIGFVNPPQYAELQVDVRPNGWLYLSLGGNEIQVFGDSD